MNDFYLDGWLHHHRTQLHGVLSANLPPPEGARPNSATLNLIPRYDTVFVAFSGGKDCLAAVLHLLDLLNGDRSRVELWHHLVDGEHGDFWDWPVTRA